MSRLARQRSESGIYHIIIRGINKQVTELEGTVPLNLKERSDRIQ